MIQALSPLWLLFLPLAGAPLVFAMRHRERWACLLAAFCMLLSVRLCLSMPFDWSIDFLGRTILLQPFGRTFLAGIYLLAAIHLTYASFVSQGRAFSYLVLIVTALLSAATMVQNGELAVLLLEIALAFMVLSAQPNSLRSVRGALYYLLGVSIAGPFLLIMLHLTQTRVLNPIDSTLPQTAAVLLALGVTALLGATPFQAWLYNVCLEASPLMVSFITSVAHGVIFFKLLGWLRDFPWLIQDGRVLSLLFAIGLVSTSLGGVLLLFQKESRAAFAWLILFDTGCLFMSLSSLPSEGPALVTFLWINRAISVSLVGIGMGMVAKAQTGRSFFSWSGLVWQQPFSVLAVAVGGLSLAGFPLTAGFTSRWLTVQSLPVETQRWMVTLAVMSAAAYLGCLRWLATTAGNAPSETYDDEPTVLRAIILLLVAANLFLAIYPQTSLQLLLRILETA